MVARFFSISSILMLYFTGISELSAQSLFESMGRSDTGYSLSGYIRSYGFVSRGNTGNYHFSSYLSDLTLKIDAGNTSMLKAYGELRYSYGSLNDVAISSIDLREAWVGFYPGRFSLEAGRKIVTWGRGDLFTPFSISPSDDIVRSPDSEDHMIGNMIISGGYAITGRISVTAMLIPLYIPSVLPVNVINMPPSISYDKPAWFEYNKSFSAGLGIRSDYNTSFADISLYLFEGYDLLPVIYMSGFDLFPPDPDPIFSIYLKERSFRTRMISVDAEGTLSGAVWRAGISRSIPDKSDLPEGYLPFGQTSWMAGVDINAGESTITVEYGGSFVHDWYRSPVEPLLPGGNITDEIAALTPEEIEGLLKEQIIAFNRLYRYQTEKWNNMIGGTVSGSAAYGRFNYTTSLIFNLTSYDLLLKPSLEYLPYDRISLMIGLEYWWGKKNSLYSYLSDNLTSLLISAKISF
ncbi:MAG: hypothetical protein ABR519_06420 [Bacteroidales bacterium]